MRSGAKNIVDTLQEIQKQVTSMRDGLGKTLTLLRINNDCTHTSLLFAGTIGLLKKKAGKLTSPGMTSFQPAKGINL
jgi:hypothetical protein